MLSRSTFREDDMTIRISKWFCILFLLTPDLAGAQSTDAPQPARSLAEYRKEPGIDPGIWKPIGGAGIASAKGKLAKLPKKWDFGVRTVPAANPQKIALSQVEIRTTALDDGFVLVETKVEGESNSSTTSELSWLGLVSVRSQTNSYTQVSGTFTGSTPLSVVASRKLDKLRSLDLQIDMIKPGYRWSHDYAMAVETASKSTMVSKQSTTTINVKQDCEVAQGGAAGSLSPLLTGNFLSVTCRSAEDSFRELLYLEDYAYFISKRTKTKLFDAEYKLTEVAAQ
jgi:hypothetical protein